MKNLFKRKKGSLIVEFVIIIPVIYLAALCCQFIIMYSMASNTLHQAAIEGARALTQELRGSSADIPNTTAMKALLSDNVKTSVAYFSYIELFHDQSGNSFNPTVYIEPSSHDCLATVQNIARAICATTVHSTASGVEQQQIVVVIRSKFYVLGNIIPGLAGNTYSKGQGSSEKEISGRFNYWN